MVKVKKQRAHLLRNVKLDSERAPSIWVKRQSFSCNGQRPFFHDQHVIPSGGLMMPVSACEYLQCIDPSKQPAGLSFHCRQVRCLYVY